MCANSDLNFGECNSSRFEIEILDVEDITNIKIHVSALVDGYEKEIPLFTGYVDSAKIQPERDARKIVAYDELYSHANDNVSEWYDGMFSYSIKPEYRGEWDASTEYMNESTVKYNGAFYRYLCASDARFSMVAGYDDEGNEIITTYLASQYLVGKNPEEILNNPNINQYIQRLDVYNHLNYGSITVKEFRDALFSYVGIAQEEISLINDSVQITKTLDSAEIKFSDCVKAICQMNAVFGHISENGVFRYISLQESEEDFSGNYKASNTTYEEYSTAKIDSVRLYGNSGDISVIYGSGDNFWNISNNFLLYSLSDDILSGIAKRLYEAVSNISYTPVSLTSLLSIFPIGLGSIFNFTTHTGEKVYSYVLKDVLSGSQLINQTVTAEGSEKRSQAMSPTDALGMLNSKTNAVVEKIYEKITSDSAEIKVISGNLANYKTVVAEKIDAVSGEFQTLKSKQAEFESATAKDFTAVNATVHNLQAEYASFKSTVTSDLAANKASIEELSARAVTTEYLSSNYAAIDLANIKQGCITTAMLGTGIVGTAQIADGSITDAKIVELTANKITAGTLSVERLEIRGSANSLVYAINDISGAMQAQNVDTINGEVLTQRTITADKIVAGAITANEIAAGAITANKIAANTITAAKIASGTITAAQIASGTITADKINISNLFAQDITATGTIRGVNLVGAKGSFSGEVTASSFHLNGNYLKCASDTFVDRSLVKSGSSYVIEDTEIAPVIQVPPPSDGKAGGVLFIDAVEAVKITGKIYGVTKLISNEAYIGDAGIYTLKAKTASVESLSTLKEISEAGALLSNKYALKSAVDALNTKTSMVNPSTNQLQSTNVGTPGRVTVFTYGNSGFIDFDITNSKKLRFEYSEYGLYAHITDNNTLIKSKTISTF